MVPFFGLRIYSVHFKPEAGIQPERIRFVSEGFNFYAFAFTIFWALFNRCWSLVVILAVVNALLALAFYGLDLHQATLNICQLGINLWTGFHGNDFLRKRLDREGYLLYALVSGENEIRAEQRFFDTHHAVLNIK
tara:strand:- start:548 stop:952 length:405 start_codon:yes stop_codon:yes gene_type:complete